MLCRSSTHAAFGPALPTPVPFRSRPPFTRLLRIRVCARTPSSLRGERWSQPRVSGPACSLAAYVAVSAPEATDAPSVGSAARQRCIHARAGSIPPKPQPGNPPPRCFRLPEQDAIINRYGFNSRGADAAHARLAAYRERLAHGSADHTKARSPCARSICARSAVLGASNSARGC